MQVEYLMSIQPRRTAWMAAARGSTADPYRIGKGASHISPQGLSHLWAMARIGLISPLCSGLFTGAASFLTTQALTSLQFSSQPIYLGELQSARQLRPTCLEALCPMARTTEASTRMTSTLGTNSPRRLSPFQPSTAIPSSA
jgi:hypothetical protein